jgi:superfamily II DNA or RNA helicase
MPIYFGEHYDLIRYPLAEEGREGGLRRSQCGAIHAIASHFTLRNEPAIVVMPTGSGKTAVLIMAAYIQRAKRVLVVTPSRLVRNQIVEEFKSLRTLKSIGVLHEKCLPPKVKEIDGRITTIEGWKQLEEYDVAIGTPNSTSPAISQVAVPPSDLFDLILVDEACRGDKV